MAAATAAVVHALEARDSDGKAEPGSAALSSSSACAHPRVQQVAAREDGQQGRFRIQSCSAGADILAFKTCCCSVRTLCRGATICACSGCHIRSRRHFSTLLPLQFEEASPWLEHAESILDRCMAIAHPESGAPDDVVEQVCCLSLNRFLLFSSFSSLCSRGF